MIAGASRPALTPAPEVVLASEGRRLYAIAFAILRDSGEAEDVLQETMLRAWRSWSGLRDEDRRSAWLSRICVRESIRRGRRRDAYSRAAGAARAVNTDGALFSPRDMDLDGALAKLTHLQRAVVVLHYHHGYHLDECAELMGCRPGTARSHLARALAKLRTEIDR